MEYTTLSSRWTNSSKSAPMPVLPRTYSHLLQRKCACGGTPGPSGECEECRKKRQGTVQRATLDRGLTGCSAPPIVQDVLRSPGQPLDTQTRAFMEPRFGHDFSQVRVHTDTRAADSAQAVNALAYTVGRDVVFGAGQYAPTSPQGRALLAHELMHVLQQGGTPFQFGSALRVGAPGDRFEQQAEAAARSSSLPTLAGSAQTANTLQRAVEEVTAQSGGGAKEPEDPCAGWFSDRESTTKRAAEHYVQTELVGDRGVVERIECDLILPSGEFACTAHFTDGTPIRVLVKKNEIIVSVAPINTMHPPPDRPLCWYDYKCTGPNRELVLTKRKCQSSKPAGSTPSGNGGRGPNP